MTGTQRPLLPATWRRDRAFDAQCSISYSEGKHDRTTRGKETIDARGLVVAPGFTELCDESKLGLREPDTVDFETMIQRAITGVRSVAMRRARPSGPMSAVESPDGPPIRHRRRGSDCLVSRAVRRESGARHRTSPLLLTKCCSRALRTSTPENTQTSRVAGVQCCRGFGHLRLEYVMSPSPGKRGACATIARQRQVIGKEVPR